MKVTGNAINYTRTQDFTGIASNKLGLVAPYEVKVVPEPTVNSSTSPESYFCGGKAPLPIQRPISRAHHTHYPGIFLSGILDRKQRASGARGRALPPRAETVSAVEGKVAEISHL